MESHASPLTVGIIGFGGFGRFLQQSWSPMEELAVTAVADSNSDIDAAGLSHFPRWQDLLADPTIDIVSIASPPNMHAEMACAAIESGKHVLVEKPLALVPEDARRIATRQEESSVVATVDYMLRFNPIVELIQEWARSRTFGALRRVLVENYAQDESLPRDHWFWNRASSGGILIEHAVHFIDVVHGCTAADPVHIDGFAQSRDDGRVDRMGLSAIYEDGLVMSQYHAFSRPGFFESTSMRFVFDLAQIEVQGWIPLRGRVHALVTEETEAQLKRLPGVEVTRGVQIESAEDQSRPAGWGPISAPVAASLRSGGVAYAASHEVELTYEMPAKKSDVYADCLRALMRDFVHAVRDPAHRLRVTLRDGISSLEVAAAASRSAFGRSDEQ